MLIFFPKSDRLFLQRYDIRFNKEHWISNGTIFSMQDLSSAQLVLRHQYCTQIAFPMRLVILQIYFNNHPVTLRHPSEPDVDPLAHTYVFTLPSSEAITNFQSNAWSIPIPD
jgi:hypothetical protein